MTQKEINKFLANTKVYVAGKSEEIQEKLFSLGYKWCDGGVNVDFTKSPFLFIYENMVFVKNSDMEHFSSHKNREISAEEILSLELTEPDYIPFKSKEECWQEMMKHQPFGWITDGFYKTTISVKSNSIVLTISSDEYVYADAFHTFKFTDGTPFGIKKNQDMVYKDYIF